MNDLAYIMYSLIDMLQTQFYYVPILVLTYQSTFISISYIFMHAGDNNM